MTEITGGAQPRTEQPQAWRCVRCKVEHVSLVSAGCPSCGAGAAAPYKQVATPPPPAERVRQPLDDALAAFEREVAAPRMTLADPDPGDTTPLRVQPPQPQPQPAQPQHVQTPAEPLDAAALDLIIANLEVTIELLKRLRTGEPTV